MFRTNATAVTKRGRDREMGVAAYLTVNRGLGRGGVRGESRTPASCSSVFCVGEAILFQVHCRGERVSGCVRAGSGVARGTERIRMKWGRLETPGIAWN